MKNKIHHRKESVTKKGVTRSLRERKKWRPSIQFEWYKKGYTAQDMDSSRVSDGGIGWSLQRIVVDRQSEYTTAQLC